MRKFLPAFLLFLSLISLVSCSITKRRYTGGYDVSWNSKRADIGTTNQVLIKRVKLNKIAQANSAHENPIATPQKEKTFTQKIIHAVKYSLKEVQKISPLYPAPIAYPLVQDNIPGHDLPVKTNPDRDLYFSFGFFLLGLGIGILLSYIVIADFDPVGDPAALIIILPIVFFIISLIHSFKAMKGGHNLELILIVLFDIFFLLVLAGIMAASL
jgi:hypothetical protein